MKACRDNVLVGNVVIFLVDEFRNGNIEEFDGNVLGITAKGIDVIYLSGHRSRNDFIPWKDVLAKVDKRRSWVKLKNCVYSGNFLVFSEE